MYALTTGLSTGYSAARRVFADPTGTYQSRSAGDLVSTYDLLWSYYSNELFDRLASGPSGMSLWSTYRAAYHLYRDIRLIYNPTRRLVDFYAGQVYPGVLAIDTSLLPDGVPSAIPFGPATPPALSSAIDQFWQWSNWQAKKAVMVRFGSALGSVLVEVVDDVERGKVTASIQWPGYIRNLKLDPAGNVKSYAIEYQAVEEQDDGQRRQYLYRKEVDGTAFRYYRDGQPFNYGQGAVVPNPYGFVPAVWIKHTDTGGDLGSPAIAGSLGKIDELNNLASHVHDQIHKVIGAPLILWAGGSLQNLFTATKRGATDDFVEPSADQESVLMLKGPPGGRVDSLAGALSLADAMTYIDKLLDEVEQDHPELVFYRELRAMSQVTGPAAQRLVGDVASRVLEASCAYDRGSIALFQMACAIGGMRANDGAWGQAMNRQQQKFLPFNLDSYERGDVDVTLLPRPVLTPTGLEIATTKQTVWSGVGLAAKAGVPLEIVLEDEGWSEEKLTHFRQLRDAEDHAAQQAQQQAQQHALLLAQARGTPQSQPGGQQHDGQSETAGQSRQAAQGE